MRSFFSYTVTEWPARRNCCAAARPAGPLPTTATLLPVFCSRRLGMNPALVPCALDNAALNQLDGNRRLVDAQHAGGFAGRGTDASGELREVVGGVQAADCIFPAAVVDEIVPIGNEVVDRTAGMAEGHAAIHAARALLALLLLRERLVNLEPVLDPFVDLAARRQFALKLQKPSDLTHAAPLPVPSPEATHCRGIRRTASTRGNAEHALVFVRKDFDEARLRVGPVLQNPRGLRAAGVVAVSLQQAADQVDIFCRGQRLQIDARQDCSACREVALLVIDIGEAAAHAGGKIAARSSQHHDRAVGHVLAAMVAHAFHHRGCAGVADGEAFAGDAVEENLAAGCAVEDDVADQDALLGQEARVLGG